MNSPRNICSVSLVHCCLVADLPFKILSLYLKPGSLNRKPKCNSPTQDWFTHGAQKPYDHYLLFLASWSQICLLNHIVVFKTVKSPQRRKCLSPVLHRTWCYKYIIPVGSYVVGVYNRTQQMSIALVYQGACLSLPLKDECLGKSTE